ncbi:hypothetical protein HZF08_12395 [Paenibacillus sp. CGMCC 1.16610]|uniref:Uncharacterized protein n=1 Tax=Paenibacillus anseongense TaxID=2682845 RepID=A0ABW9U9J5_9BACL|nr:hypothetical protein [Paenibacillus sp. CGMCC 1.16610]MVQ35065.1 hypothetical protein [Paenibacillus anseongense]
MNRQVACDAVISFSLSGLETIVVSSPLFVKKEFRSAVGSSKRQSHPILTLSKGTKLTG